MIEVGRGMQDSYRRHYAFRVGGFKTEQRREGRTEIGVEEAGLNIEDKKEALDFANDIPKEVEIEIEFASSLIVIELAEAHGIYGQISDPVMRTEVVEDFGYFLAFSRRIGQKPWEWCFYADGSAHGRIGPQAAYAVGLLVALARRFISGTVLGAVVVVMASENTGERLSIEQRRSFPPLIRRNDQKDGTRTSGSRLFHRLSSARSLVFELSAADAKKVILEAPRSGPPRRAEAQRSGPSGERQGGQIGDGMPRLMGLMTPSSGVSVYSTPAPGSIPLRALYAYGSLYEWDSQSEESTDEERPNSAAISNRAGKAVDSAIYTPLTHSLYVSNGSPSNTPNDHRSQVASKCPRCCTDREGHSRDTYEDVNRAVYLG
ncbi:hypothetical protein C8R45DRAFT_946388 [Mycena sanguinolenta]|nr:hypothetical protein C8R45DRAFT_946388 [Mycena sanguinolenta]